jgi:hypothetical protein
MHDVPCSNIIQEICNANVQYCYRDNIYGVENGLRFLLVEFWQRQ